MCILSTLLCPLYTSVSIHHFHPYLVLTSLLYDLDRLFTFYLYFKGPTGHDIAPKEDFCLQKQELEQSTNTDITTEVLRKKTKGAKRQAVREVSIEAELAPTSTKNTKEIKSVCIGSVFLKVANNEE